MCGALVWKAVKFRVKGEKIHRKQMLFVLLFSFLCACFSAQRLLSVVLVLNRMGI